MRIMVKVVYKLHYKKQNTCLDQTVSRTTSNNNNSKTKANHTTKMTIKSTTDDAMQ